MFIIFSKPDCPFCVKAKEALDARDIPYNEVDVTLEENEPAKQWLKDHGFTKVPQIFYHKTHIGGWDKLKGYLDFRYDPHPLPEEEPVS